jgi:hypothetical protein
MCHTYDRELRRVQKGSINSTVPVFDGPEIILWNHSSGVEKCGNFVLYTFDFGVVLLCVYCVIFNWNIRLSCRSYRNLYRIGPVLPPVWDHCCTIYLLYTRI